MTTTNNTTSIMKPGILVSLKTSLHGGVTYTRIDLEAEAGKRRWETTCAIDDPEEYERARRVRSQAGGVVRRLCSVTAFGLLCPEDKEAELDAALAAARTVTAEHNATARGTQVHVYVLKGRIASTDEEAARAIASEVNELLSEMEAGIKRADVAAIRDAASRAKKIGQVLEAEQGEAVTRAIAVARKAARDIAKRVEKEGEDAQRVIEEISLVPIQRARFAWLDLDEPVASTEAPMPIADVRRMGALDLDAAAGSEVL